MEAPYTITLAYIHPGFVRAEFMDSVIRSLADPRYQISLVQVGTGTNVQIGRNQAFRKFLEHTSDYLIFADSDMCWHPDAIEELIQKDVPICSVLYLGRDENNKAFPVGMKWSTPDAMGAVDHFGRAMEKVTLEDLDGTLVETAGVGMGLCVIRREVCEAMREGNHEHPDTWPFAVGQTKLPTGAYLFMGEDITFCVRARDLGYRSYIATDVHAGHVKEFIMSPPDAGEAKVTLSNNGHKVMEPV